MEDLHAREMGHLGSAFQAMRNELVEANRTHSALQVRQNNESRRLHSLATDLKDRLQFSDLQMTSMRSELDKKNAVIAEYESQLQQQTTVCVNQEAVLKKQAEIIAGLEDRVHSQEKQLVEMKGVLHVSTRATEERVQTQAQKLGATTEEARRLEACLEAERSHTRLLEAKLEHQATMSRDVAAELLMAKEAIGNTHNIQASLDRKIDECTRLWRDNARLVTLLHQAQGYHMQSLAEEFDDNAGATYVQGSNPAGVKIELDCQLYEAYQGRDRGALEVQFPREGESWVPTQAAELVSEFRRRHARSVSAALLEDLLLQLNNIWRARERRKVGRIKAKYARKAQEWKRVLLQRAPYETVMQGAEISRLRAEIDQMRR